ncbi:MAG: hypothetical protein AAF267_04980 [Deinococcota bacterium]
MKLRQLLKKAYTRLQNLWMNRDGLNSELPPLPRHPSRGVVMNKGDTFTVTDFSISVEDLSEAGDEGDRLLHLRVPSWASEYKCGATYLLKRQVKGRTFNIGNARVDIGQDGWSIEVALRQTTQDLVRSTSAVAKSVLDLLAADAFQISDLKDPLRQHGLWFHGEEGTTLRAVTTGRLAVRMQLAIEVKDPEGKVRSQHEPKLRWHASHSYFRRSQITDDLHDAYRNLFLALEAMLSEIYPWKVGMGERKWLKSALRHAMEGYGLNMHDFVGGDGGNPYRRFMKEQYRARRYALFHSKLDEAPTIPSDMTARDDLVIATRRLGQLYVHLARLITGAGFAGGMMSEAAFTQMMQSFNDSLVYISQKPDFSISSCLMSSLDMTLNVNGDGSLHHLKGKWASGNIPAHVRRTGITLRKDGDVVDGMHDIVDINTSGASILEVVFQNELANANNLREWFL